MRQVVLYIAMSLDGYIADTEGGVGWLDRLEGGQAGYAALLKETDTVVMGWNTYHQITTQLSPGAWPYEGLRCYVATHRPLADTPRARFTADPCGLVRRLKARPGKQIWLCGGANLAGQLLAAGLCDRLWLSVAPVVLGGGIPLFGPSGAPAALELLKARRDRELVELEYRCPAAGTV